jgi:hypothetical protein
MDNSTIKLSDDDWGGIKPDQFENLCAELLELLDFKNVKRMDGPGDQGVDITCNKVVEKFPGISRNEYWIVQCKHYTKGIKKTDLDKDLVDAKEHSAQGSGIDSWLLITTAKLTPNLKKSLRNLSKSNVYPFEIDYLDREDLNNLLTKFLRLISKYFPDKVNETELRQEEAMDLMSLGKYDQAAELLRKTDDGTHPRHSYLLACCYSMLSLKEDNAAMIDSAFEYLSEASKRGLLDFMHRRFGWPESRCLYEIHKDLELQYIKNKSTNKFKGIFPEPYTAHLGGGGCLTGDTLIRIENGQLEPISNLRLGEKVISLITNAGNFYSEISSKYKARAETIIKINSEIRTTFEHPFHTTHGWCRAGDLNVGDLLTTAHGSKMIKSLEFENTSTTVYDLKLLGMPQYYANGYLVHNKMALYDKVELYRL